MRPGGSLQSVERAPIAARARALHLALAAGSGAPGFAGNGGEGAARFVAWESLARSRTAVAEDRLLPAERDLVRSSVKP
jgi:hypothetical protein